MIIYFYIEAFATKECLRCNLITLHMAQLSMKEKVPHHVLCDLMDDTLLC